MNKAVTLTIAIILAVVLPSIALAQPTASWKEYTLLAPILKETSIESFGQYLGLVFKGTIAIAAVLAVVMITICGIKLMTSEAISSKGEAKECITNAIFGLLLAIASWAILNTINPALLETNLGIVLPDSQNAKAVTKVPKTEEIPSTPGWYFKYQDRNGNIKFQSAGMPTDGGEKCEALKKTYAERGLTILKTTIGGVEKECFFVPPSAFRVSASELDVRRQLCGEPTASGCIPPDDLKDDSRVYVNKKACAPGEKSCTNVGGLPSSAIAMIKKLAGDSGCAVVVSGGTEPGHTITGGSSDHRENNPTFDLRHGRSCLDNYIKSNGLNKSSGGTPTRSGIPSCPGGRAGTFCGNLRWYLPAPSGPGFWFIEERFNNKGVVIPHWHVCQHGATGYGNNPATPTPYCNDPA